MNFAYNLKQFLFLSTFGLLISLFIVGFLLAYFLHLPITVALLFGALISATDPIAVLVLFKTLGAPKRLSLIADGESMFNDATAVIAFKVVSAFAVGGSYLAPVIYSVALQTSYMFFLEVFFLELLVHIFFHLSYHAFKVTALSLILFRLRLRLAALLRLNTFFIYLG